MKKKKNKFRGEQFLLLCIVWFDGSISNNEVNTKQKNCGIIPTSWPDTFFDYHMVPVPTVGTMLPFILIRLSFTLVSFPSQWDSVMKDQILEWELQKQSFWRI